MEKILVIGAAGQIGSELVLALRKIYGSNNVFATDIKQAPTDIVEGGPFQILDVLDNKKLTDFVIRHKISQIYHLAAILSGNAEKNPIRAWRVNMRSLMNVLEIAKETAGLQKVFWPSSIAVFGKTTPRINTPQLTITEPNTVYGISKVAGERWCEYFNNHYNIDVRSIRYPGLISYKTKASGGTTDYAVEIFYDAVQKGKYECFLKKDTILPMMFMEDAINATVNLMEAPAKNISIHSSYNAAGISFAPKDVAAEIKKIMPNFEIIYKPDFRQAIADSWPKSIDDSLSCKEWNCSIKYDLPKMTEVMLAGIKAKFQKVGQKI